MLCRHYLGSCTEVSKMMLSVLVDMLGTQFFVPYPGLRELLLPSPVYHTGARELVPGPKG